MNNEKPHYPKGQSPAQIAHRLKMKANFDKSISGKNAVRKQKNAARAREKRAEMRKLCFAGEHLPTELLNGQNYRDSVKRRVESGSFMDNTIKPTP